VNKYLKNALAVLAFVAAPVLAHHSAVQFDFANTVLVTGLVKEARFANPHMHLVMEVTDDKRGTRDITYEGHSRNNMVRQGLTPDLFGVGDVITIRIAPMRNGNDGGYITAVKAPDGTEVGRVTGAD
jgi:hypothetical protein